MNTQIPQLSAGPIVFSLQSHPLVDSLTISLIGVPGECNTRQFPDGESYLRVVTPVENRPCVVIADLSQVNSLFLPLIFLLETLRELGASSVGLVAPYLSYMRQDRRFVPGEAVTSRIFAKSLSQHIDWLVTVDPHLHRYHSLDEIYSVPSRVVQGAPALAQWLKKQKNLLLVGPDEESEQWLSDIAKHSGHRFVIGEKKRFGDRNVEITLPDLSRHQNKTAVIIDDVISSGQTILECIKGLQAKGIEKIQCAAVHGIFADNVYVELLEAGLESLVTTNTIVHRSNAVDVTRLLLAPIKEFID
jgi:ribose-phosphate pyrophosphokinase